MEVVSSQLIEEKHAVQDKPERLDLFLQRTFFGTCSVHDLRKNELNKYCIDCDLSACRYCITSSAHNEHRILNIYRHVYKDVVPLSDMENHIDCSKIQPYKSNKQWVIALNPLPHCGSGSHADGDTSCDICMRRMNDPILNSYCSIACKVEAFSRKRNNSEPPFLAVQTLPPDDKGKQVMREDERKHKRKGVPHRATLLGRL